MGFEQVIVLIYICELVACLYKIKPNRNSNILLVILLRGLKAINLTLTMLTESRL